MIVNVKLYATLRRLSPPGTEIGGSFTLELDEGTISEALDKLKIGEGKAKMILVNGVHVRGLDHHLKDGDLLVVFPPVAGG
ncbi:MAG: MoaD/ThiS family protein [Candidatus Thorarchaeota archaeon]|jgi:molybdopterin converting factor small subunit